MISKNSKFKNILFRYLLKKSDFEIFQLHSVKISEKILFNINNKLNNNNNKCN